jgi:hypothetical protein
LLNTYPIGMLIPEFTKSAILLQTASPHRSIDAHGGLIEVASGYLILTVLSCNPIRMLSAPSHKSATSLQTVSRDEVMNEFETLLDIAHDGNDPRRASAEAILLTELSTNASSLLSSLLQILSNPSSRIRSICLSFTLLTRYAHTFQSFAAVLSSVVPFFTHDSAVIRNLASVTYAVHGRALFIETQSCDHFSTIVTQLPTSRHIECHINCLIDFCSVAPADFAHWTVSSLLNLLVGCSDASSASFLIDGLSSVLPIVYSSLGSDSEFNSFLGLVFWHITNPTLKLAVYRLLRNAADFLYSSIAILVLELVQISETDLTSSDSPLLLSVLELWNTIADAELEGGLSHELVFTAAPTLTPSLIRVFAAAADTAPAARQCLVSFAKLAFPLVVDIATTALSSCAFSDIGFELCDILWVAGTAEFRGSFVDHALALAIAGLDDRHAAVRRSALRLLISILHCPTYALTGLVPPLLALLVTDVENSDFAAKALALIARALPSATRESLVLEWLSVTVNVPARSAAELLYSIGARVLRGGHCPCAARLLTTLLAELVSGTSADERVEATAFALNYALSSSAPLADIARNFWTAVERSWVCTHLFYVLLLIQAFAIADCAAFALFPSGLFRALSMDHSSGWTNAAFVDTEHSLQC